MFAGTQKSIKYLFLYFQIRIRIIFIIFLCREALDFEKFHAFFCSFCSWKRSDCCEWKLSKMTGVERAIDRSIDCVRPEKYGIQTTMIAIKTVVDSSICILRGISFDFLSVLRARSVPLARHTLKHWYESNDYSLQAILLLSFKYS